MLVQFIGTWGFGLLPKGERGPYRMFFLATFGAVVYYLMHLIWLHMKDNMNVVIYDRLVVAIGIFYAISVVLLPGSILLLIHNLGAKLKVEKIDAALPLTSRLWKRAFDWILIIITFMIYIATIATSAAYVSAARSNSLSTSQAKTLLRAYEIVWHILTALIVLLFIDILVSSIILFKAARRPQWNNKVSHLSSSDSLSSNPFSRTLIAFVSLSCPSVSFSQSFGSYSTSTLRLSHPPLIAMMPRPQTSPRPSSKEFAEL